MKKGIKLCDTVDSHCCRSEWLCFPTYFSPGTFIHNKFKQRTEPDLGFFFVLSAFYLLQNLSVMDSSGCKAASLHFEYQSKPWRENIFIEAVAFLPEIEVGSCNAWDFMWWFIVGSSAATGVMSQQIIHSRKFSWLNKYLMFNFYPNSFLTFATKIFFKLQFFFSNVNECNLIGSHLWIRLSETMVWSYFHFSCLEGFMSLCDFHNFFNCVCHNMQ